jgi:hypothetical protein
MTKNDSKLRKKHDDGRWMYDKKRLLFLLDKMSLKKQNKILRKALDIIVARHTTKINAIAIALNCGYDDAGFWWRGTEIRA